MMAYSSTGIARAVEIAKEKLALKFQLKEKQLATNIQLKEKQLAANNTCFLGSDVTTPPQLLGILAQ